MKPRGAKIVLMVMGLTGTAALLAWLFLGRIQDGTASRPNARALRAAPVEVAMIERGLITDQRVFSGELEALAEFVVAPKVNGRVERVRVNIADTVTRGQVVAELDNDEYLQSVAQAEADLVVAQARRADAQSALEIAEREFKRTESLVKRGIASDSEFDATRQNRLAREAQLKVAVAEVTKAESSLASAKIRLGYTQVTAGWTGGGEQRIVAERYVDEGQTVAANTPLLLIVELDPIVGIFFVTERDYAQLAPGQSVTLTTDAFPGEQFTGRIDRIAPIFRKATRQARIEMAIANPQHRLKPGMFIRATVILDQVPEATIVPEQALTTRDDRRGVFILDAEGKTVEWHEVEIGIRDGERVQVTGRGLSGRVVVLGQQLISDGAPVTLPKGMNPAVAGGAESEPR